MDHILAVLLKGYPRLSETFIAQELLELEKRGLKLHIYSLRHPYDPDIHELHRQIQAPVTYLPEYVRDEPLSVLTAILSQLHKPGFWQSLSQLIADFSKDRSLNRLRRFAQAAVLSRILPKNNKHIYVHFMHTPGSVGLYASMMSGKTWSISAHAKDIWTIPEWEKRLKLNSAEWAVTCTDYNRKHMQTLCNPEKIRLIYHGLDFSRFPAPPDREQQHNPRFEILTVCRAVQKKGLDSLLKSLSLLPSKNWQWTHVGGGELLDTLKQQADELNISDHIRWMGALPQDKVIQAYRDADIFVLPSRIAADGDRDGLPNVLMEAQLQALCCVSSNVSGVGELIEHQITGLLLEPDDINNLCESIQLLADDRELRLRLAAAGHDKVTTHFSVDLGLEQLHNMLLKVI